VQRLQQNTDFFHKAL